MTAKTGKKPPKVERFNQRHYLEAPGKPPLLSEWWTKDETRRVIHYGLAYIDFSIYPEDNGRVLGYDNGHNFHERHFMGQTEKTTFTTYEDQAKRFFDEVDKLREETKHARGTV